jgi:hypothetical protein
LYQLRHVGVPIIGGGIKIPSKGGFGIIFPEGEITLPLVLNIEGLIVG